MAAGAVGVMTGCEVRPATAADVQGILAIYNDAVLNTTATAEYDPVTFQARAQWLAEHQDRGYPVNVAVNDEGFVLGWSSLSEYKSRIGYRFSAETSVYIHPEHRGRGIGRALLARLVIDGDHLGLHNLMAVIEATNEASIRLHGAFGFEVCGRAREVYRKFDRWLDVVTMQKLLDDEA